ncbi:MAG: hypothetical protein AB7F43_07020 [Bacteriovoracia bacterium]
MKRKKQAKPKKQNRSGTLRIALGTIVMLALSCALGAVIGYAIQVSPFGKYVTDISIPL